MALSSLLSKTASCQPKTFLGKMESYIERYNSMAMKTLLQLHDQNPVEAKKQFSDIMNATIQARQKESIPHLSQDLIYGFGENNIHEPEKGYAPYLNQEISKFKKIYPDMNAHILSPDDFSKDNHQALLSLEKDLNSKKTGLYFLSSKENPHIDAMIAYQGNLYILQIQDYTSSDISKSLKNRFNHSHEEGSKEGIPKIFTIKPIKTKDEQGKEQIRHWHGDMYSCGIMAVKHAKQILQNECQILKESLVHPEDQTFMPSLAVFIYNQSKTFVDAYQKTFQDMINNPQWQALEGEKPQKASEGGDLEISKVAVFFRHLKYFKRTRERFEEIVQTKISDLEK